MHTFLTGVEVPAEWNFRQLSIFNINVHRGTAFNLLWIHVDALINPLVPPESVLLFRGHDPTPVDRVNVAELRVLLSVNRSSFDQRET